MPGQSERAPTVTLGLEPSPGLAGLMFLGWVPLLGLGWLAGQGSPLLLPLMGLIAAMATMNARQCALVAPGNTFAALAIRDNKLTSRDPQGAILEWRLGKGSRLFSRLAWLELSMAGGRNRTRLIVTDLPGLANLPREDFRRLRVWLRLGASYH